VVTQSTYWFAGRLRVWSGVGPFGAFQDPAAEVWITSDFTAPFSDATLRTTVSWHGSLNTLASFGSGTAVEIDLGIYELDGDALGARIAGTAELDEEILAEAIQSGSIINYADSVSRSYDRDLTPGLVYRVELRLTCSARATFALSATTCEFGSSDRRIRDPTLPRGRTSCSPMSESHPEQLLSRELRGSAPRGGRIRSVALYRGLSLRAVAALSPIRRGTA
jgi:hypothetical protein